MKHEQAILVALAYVIGFTTAFIAFSINDSNGYSSVSKSYNQNNKNLVSKAHAEPTVQALINDEGLFALKDGAQRILSAQVSGAVVENTGGYHKKIVATSVSPDGRFIYYCAQVSDSEECMNFVYVLSEDKVYSVKDESKLAVTPFTAAKEAFWSENGTLNLAGMTSQNSESPWQLGQ